MAKELLIKTEKGKYQELKVGWKTVHVIVEGKEQTVFRDGMNEVKPKDIKPGTSISYNTGRGNILPVGKIKKVYRLIA